MARNSDELAKRFIDASIKGRAKPPSKASYARALRMAREAIEDLTHVASRSKARA